MRFSFPFGKQRITSQRMVAREIMKKNKMKGFSSSAQ